MKKIIIVLIGTVLISFGVGFFSLKLSQDNVRDGFKIKFDDKNYSVNINSNKTNVNRKDGDYVLIDEKDNTSIKGIEEIEIDVDIATVNIISDNRDEYFHPLSWKNLTLYKN